MELTERSETSAHKIQTEGITQKKIIQHLYMTLGILAVQCMLTLVNVWHHEDN